MAQDRPRVLWLTPTLSSRFGGPTTTTTNGLIAEHRAGLASEVLTTVGPSGPGDSRPAIDRLRDNGVICHVFRRSSDSESAETWGISFRMVVWLMRNAGEFDVLHLQYVWCLTSLAGCVAGRMRGVPVVVTPHESLTDYDIEVASRSRRKRLLKRLLRKFYLRTVDCLVFMSGLEERDTRRGNRRTIRISHAVAETTHRPEAPAASGGPLRIGFLGRNIKKKGIDSLIEAVAADEKGQWRLLIAGPPGTEEFRDELDDLSQRLGVSDQVEWLGYLDERARLFERCDVLAMPSDYEGFGMVAAEAMSFGIPVVVPRRSGVAEIVSEYEAGIVVDKPTATEIADALSDFDSARQEWRRYSENGLRAVEAKLTYEAYARATRRLYDSLSIER